MTPLTPEQSQIAADHWPLVLSLAKQFAADHPDIRLDFVSAASTGLVKAFETYKPELGYKFSTHAHSKIYYAMLDEVKFAAKHSQPPQSDILEFIGSPNEHPVGWEIQSQDTVESITGGLKWLSREVIILTYLYGFTQEKVARVLNLHREWVLEIHKRAIALLRQSVNAETYDRRASA